MITKAKQIALLLIVFASLVLGSYSQEVPCELNIKIFDIDVFDTLSEVNVKFTELKNKQIHKASKVSDFLVFNNLNSGIYQIELNKKGYKRKTKKFSIDCSFVDNSNKVFENIFLWKGNGKEVIKLDSTDLKDAFTISDLDKPSDAASFSIADGKNLGSVNGRAINLIRPVYPSAAKAVRASGKIDVQVIIDEDGNIIKVGGVSGHALLRVVAVKAAKQSKFAPTLLGGNPVRISGVIVYNFNPQ